MKKKKIKRFRFVLLIILGLCFITLGSSVAFFSYIKNGNMESSIKLGDITFKYAENTQLGNGITLTDAFPISDEEGKLLEGEGKVFDFKVEANLSRSDLEYEIVADVIEESTLPLDAIKFYLTDITNENQEEIISTLHSDGTVKTLDEFPETEIQGTTGKTIYQETILKNTRGYSKQFRARMWINEEIDWSDNRYMNTSGSVRINVYANSDRSMASTDTTNPDDTRIERIVANRKYLFSRVEEEQYQYTVTVPNEVDMIDIDVIPTNTGAIAEVTPINDGYGLVVGENYFRVKVISGNKEKSREYTLRVIREQSRNTNLENLQVVGYSLSPVYSDYEDHYKVEVPYQVKRIEVVATKKEEVQKVEGAGIYQLEVGNNSIYIVVTAEDGTSKIYTITVERREDNTDTLKSLELTDCTLSPSFTSETTSYSCTVANSIVKTEVKAEATSNVARIEGIGEKSLKVGENTISVVVVAQDGSRKNYTIKVTRLPNSDASLKELVVTEGILLPLFNKEVLMYQMVVPYQVEEIMITGAATSEVSTVEGLGSKLLKVGENNFSIVVTAEDKKTTRTYTIVVTREEDNDTSLKSIEVEGYSIVKVDDNHYTLTVENNVTSVEVNAKATSSLAIITGTGKMDLAVGENIKRVQVTAPNGNVSIYEVKVTRKANSDASLRELSITGQTISPVFSSEENFYTLTVPYSVEKITVNAIKNNNEASVSGAGNKTLNVGNNTIRVVVTAGDKTEKTYTIIVTRQPDTISTLKSLGLTNCTLSPEFTSETTRYSCSVSNSVTKTIVSAEANSGVASVSGTGEKKLNVGDNTISVVVTAQDGITASSYTIVVHRKSNDATLSLLSVTGYSLSPAFAGEIKNYTLTVPNTISSITVNATKNHSKASVSGTGNKELDVGNNSISVVVTAEDGNTNAYTITVKRMGKDKITLDEKSTTYTGSAIVANTASATSESDITYAYYSGTSCSGTALSGAPTDVGNYSVKATSAGNSNYESGSKCVKHTITKGTPTITLVAKSVEANGSAIAANKATAKNPNGSRVTLTYTYNYYTNNTCTTAFNTTTPTTAPTDVGTYYVKATSTATTNLNSASSGCIKHTINKNTNVNLSSLSITGYTISPSFASATQTYTATTEASSVTINAKAASGLSIVSGVGNKTLNWGSNELNVIVTSQSGSTKAYKITVTNQRPAAPTITGGSSNWVSTAPTIKVSKAGTAISGVKHYEYYKSTTNTAPNDSTAATGTTSGNLTVSDEGTRYVWYRTVSNNGNKSVWTGPQVINLDTVNTAAGRYEIKNITATGYDIYLYDVRSPQEVDRIQFPTWTTYGVQDDMEKSWQTTTEYTGVNLENGTWKYHVNISDHNYEAGKYTTDVYIFRKNGNIQLPFRIEQFVTTVNYAGSLYLENPNFNPGTVYRITNQILSNNFTFEFDAKPNKATPIYTNGTYAPTTANTYNFVVHSTLSSSTSSAGIGLSLGTNGAIAIAHSGSYFYVLLNYSGDLSLQHSYRFTIKNNIPYLYMDGKLIATGIAPLAPVNTLITFGFIGGDLGDYGNYSGYANNFVLYNNAR